MKIANFGLSILSTFASPVTQVFQATVKCNLCNNFTKWSKNTKNEISAVSRGRNNHRCAINSFCTDFRWFPQKNIFKFKRRGFHSNLASSTQGPPYKGGPPENLTLSQVSQTKQKISNQEKKFKRAKIAHKIQKTQIKAKLLTKYKNTNKSWIKLKKKSTLEEGCY